MTRRALALLATLLIGLPSVVPAQPGPNPTEWALYPNDPDVFCPDTSGTRIRFDVPGVAHVTLDVMDGAMSSAVRMLVDGTPQPGRHQAHWDGRDGSGSLFIAGVWPYRLVARDITTGETLYKAVRLATIECAGRLLVPVPGMPRQPALAPAGPNPFRDRTSLLLTLPEPQIVTLGIYDMAGRSVRTLLRGWQPAGTTTREWNGRTDSGRQVPAGLYVCVLRAGNAVLARKLLRVGG